MTILRALDRDDPRLDPFRAVGDPDLVRRRGLFVAEGRRVVEALLADARFEVERLLLSEAAHDALAAVLASRAAALETIVLEGPAALRDVTGYRFHQGCLALARRPIPRDVDEVAAFVRPGPWAAVALEGVTNPDNVGTIFRSAEAFGSVAVALSPGCAHPLYRKALRTSMGSVLRLPWAEPPDWPRALAALQAEGVVLLALTPSDEAEPLDDVLRALPSDARAIALLGNEEHGLEAQTLQAADHRVRIPMAPAADSLNVAASAAIALQRLHARRTEGTR